MEITATNKKSEISDMIEFFKTNPTSFYYEHVNKEYQKDFPFIHFNENGSKNLDYQYLFSYIPNKQNDIKNNLKRYISNTYKTEDEDFVMSMLQFNQMPPEYGYSPIFKLEIDKTSKSAIYTLPLIQLEAQIASTNNDILTAILYLQKQVNITLSYHYDKNAISIIIK